MMMTPSSNQRRKVATLSDYLLHSNDDRSRKEGKGSMHSEDSRKARSILTKKSTRIHRHAPPPHVIQPTSPQNSEEKKIDNSQEESLAMDLFQACEDCKWKVLYELMCGLQNSSDEKMRRILGIPDTANESTILHICVWKAPPALTKFIMDIIPQDLYLTTDADGNTPLHLCCGNLPIYSNGSTDVSVMKRLAKAAPHALHLANVHGDTPLHMLVSSPVCCNTEHDEALALVAEEAVGYLLDMDENLCRLQDASGALPLHVAIGCGANEAILVKLFEAAPTVAAAKDEMGMLPIHYVAAFGKTPLTVVDLLMEANPESFTEVTVDGDTPLHILASNASTSMADLSTQRMNLETEKMIEFLVGGCGDDDASRATDEQSVTSYGGKIRPLIASNKEQMNPLHCCALFNGPSQLVRLLMKNPLGSRAAIMKNELGATPLHVACAQPAVADSVTQVASLGTAASASSLDRHRRTPLHVAAQNSHATGDLIRVLSHLFPEALKEKTQRGHLPLHLAAQSQVKESVVEALIAAYPEAAQVKNHSSNTPLHDASKYKASPGVVRLLLDTYPDAVYIQNQYGNLPLHCATAYQAPAEVVQLLLAAWPDGAAMQNRNKDAPLHYAAAYTTSLDVLRPLIKASPAAVLLLNSNGQSPIDRAKANNAPSDVVRLLEEAADEWTARATRSNDRWGDSYTGDGSRSEF
jgi:ankyrin repeat protein